MQPRGRRCCSARPSRLRFPLRLPPLPAAAPTGGAAAASLGGPQQRRCVRLVRQLRLSKPKRSLVRRSLFRDARTRWWR